MQPDESLRLPSFRPDGSIILTEIRRENLLRIYDYIQMALDYDPELAVSKLNLEQKREGLKKSRAAFYPSLSAPHSHMNTKRLRMH